MLNILNYIWNYFDKSNGLLVRLVNDADGKIIGFFFKVEYIKYNNYYVSLLINLQKWFQALLSLIIFIILYKFEVFIFNDHIINIIKIYLSTFFCIFIIRLLYLLIYGYYLLNYTEEDGTLFFEGLISLIQLINFLINVKILYWLLSGLTINIFIQCNLILVIDLIMLFMLYIYIYIFDYEIKGTRICTFLSYPWIIMILSIFFIILKIDIEDYISLFINDYAILIVGEKT